MSNELRVNIIGDASKLTASLNKASSKLSSFGKKISSVGSSLSTRLTLPLALAGGAAIKLASDFEESLNKVNVAFGKSSTEVKSFAKTTLTQFGIAEGSALDMAALFGDMATSMGITRKEAADMSTSMVGLAGDLASFKNIGIDQATTALAGVFTGETESLKRLGIVMTEANLKMFAMSEGIKTNIKDMTQAEKVNLRYQFILSKTNNAQGDFARTQSGAANQMRIFTEGSKQLGQSLGSLLLPAFTKIVTKLNSLVTDFINLDNQTKSLVLSVAAFVAGIGPALIVVGKLAQAIAFLSTPIGLVVIGLTSIALIIYKNWNEILPVVVGLYNRFVDIYNASENLRIAVAGVKTAFKIAFIAIKAKIDQVLNVFSTLWNLIKEVSEKGIKGAFGDVLEKGLEKGEDIASKAGVDIKNAIIDGVSEGLQSQLEHKTISAVQGSLSKLGNKFKNSLNIFGGGGGGGGDKEEATTTDTGLASVGLDPITQLTESAKAAMPELDSILASKKEKLAQDEQAEAERLEKRKQEVIQMGNDIENTFGMMGSSIAQSLGMGESALGTFAGTMIQTAMTSIGASLATTMGFGAEAAGATAKSMGPIAAFVLPALLAGAAVAVKGAFSKVKAPQKFANGGIVSAPTMGLVGEYAGAKSNPEVIAPLDKLKGMIGDKGSQKVDVGGSFTLKGQDLVVALQRANTNRNRII